MPIPTQSVGSLPRPMKLQDAYEAYDQGDISWERLAGSRMRRRRTRSSVWRRPQHRNRHSSPASPPTVHQHTTPLHQQPTTTITILSTTTTTTTTTNPQPPLNLHLQLIQTAASNKP